MDTDEETSTLQQPNITTEMWGDIFTTSSDEEPRLSETVDLSITQAHRDPLEECMDGVEAFVHELLKTGKVTVTGDAGDLSKLHAVLFGLQATEKELPQLLLQLMHTPFFAQNPSCAFLQGCEGGCEGGVGYVAPAPDHLGDGLLQVGIHIDTLIYQLLHSHCVGQARQAEQLVLNSITHLSSTSSTSSSASSTTTAELGPPLIFASSLSRPQLAPPTSPLLLLAKPFSAGSMKSNTSSSSVGSERSPSQSSCYSISSMDDSTFPADPLSTISECPRDTDLGDDAPPCAPNEDDHTRRPTAASTTTTTSTTTPITAPLAPQSKAGQPAQSYGSPGSYGLAGDSPFTQQVAPPSEISSIPSTITPAVLKNPALRKIVPERRISVVTMTSPTTIHRSSKSSDSEFSGDETLDPRSRNGSSSSARHGSDSWHVYSPDPKDLVVGAYGDNAYPLLMWDPSLKAEFKLSSSLGILSGSVVAIEPSKPTVTIKVKNPTAMELGFSLRAYRQTVAQRTHIVFPTRGGLHKLEPYGHWEDKADFMSSEGQEFFVLELFVCALMGTPVWNVMRKYAVMKATKSNSNTLTVSKPRKFTHFQFPGTSDTKEQNLKTVIAQGLQCTIKDKLVPAEIIFTQALLLPDFQRLPLQAFVHICLAVIANKKSKDRSSLQPVIAQSNCVAKLLDIWDSSPGHVKMPKMIMLVKQLKKELNLPKVLRETKKREKRTRLQKSINDSMDMDSSGGQLTGSGEGSMTLTVPPGALPHQTKVTLVGTNTQHLQSMLAATGWDQTVAMVMALEVHCSPVMEEFEQPVEIDICLPPPTTTTNQRKSLSLSGLGSLPQLCLLHSKYMRHWQDITTETTSSVAVTPSDEGGGGTRIRIRTLRVGHLAVARVTLDPFRIAQIAMRSLVTEPVVLQISVFAEIFQDDSSAQVVIIIQPCKPQGEPLDPAPIKPQNHTPVSFPHVVQAYAGERLRLSLAGRFESHSSYGQTDLNFVCDVSESINQVYEKWVRLQAGKPLVGKLLVTTCRTTTSPSSSTGIGGGGTTEMLAEINISTRAEVRCSSSSST